ncbi:hypothetical protein MNBD_BACTEROID06-824 [hydrothermal vent metagenome]|uniref:Uncharacterized protein n=1 Tax=hydrothermal vent metagenome TaxID=652676 RepID=A0A3B0UN73_9ZZZZ
MKNKEQYIEDLKEIKKMMNRSSKFISLSGLSGISAGVIALIAAWFAHSMVYSNTLIYHVPQNISQGVILNLLLVAVATITAAVLAGVFFTKRKAKQINQPLWDTQTRLLLVNMAIPLITGGLLCVLLLQQGLIGLLAPLTLVFYGLALVNASKYTFKEVGTLGVVEIILGLVAVQFIGYSLYFWAFGFGILHIVYGIIMQSKYGS